MMRSALALSVALGMVWGLVQALTHHLAPLLALVDIAAYALAGAGAAAWAWLLWRLASHYWPR